MSTRVFTCEGCGERGEAGRFGPIRRFCDPCRISRHAGASKQHTERQRLAGQKRFRKANPEYFYNRSLIRFYGIDRDAYDSLLAAQQGLCKICRKPPSGGPLEKRLHVDHCHKTGIVRGLLCGGCNKGIGLLKDDPNLIEAALRYILEAAQ